MPTYKFTVAMASNNEGARANTNCIVSGSTYFMLYNNTSNVVYGLLSRDAGSSWQTVQISPGGSYGASIWYDGWSGLDTGHFHVAYCQNGASGSALVRYRRYNLADMSSSNETVSLAQTAATDATYATTAVCVSTGGLIGVAYRATTANTLYGGDFGFSTKTSPSSSWIINSHSAGILHESAISPQFDYAYLLPSYSSSNSMDFDALFCDNSSLELTCKHYDFATNNFTEVTQSSYATFVSWTTGRVAPVAVVPIPEISQSIGVYLDRNPYTNILSANNTVTMRSFTLDHTGVYTGSVIDSVTTSASFVSLELMYDVESKHLMLFYSNGFGVNYRNFFVNGTNSYIMCRNSVDYGSTWSDEKLFFSSSNSGSLKNVINNLVGTPHYYRDPLLTYRNTRAALFRLVMINQQSYLSNNSNLITFDS